MQKNFINDTPFFLQLFNAMAMTMVFAYLPQLVKVSVVTPYFRHVWVRYKSITTINFRYRLLRIKDISRSLETEIGILAIRLRS